MFGKYCIRAHLKGNFNDELVEAEIYIEAAAAPPAPTNTVNPRTLNFAALSHMHSFLLSGNLTFL
jgi:hypothetical protein